MKKLPLIWTLLFALVLTTSCENGFDELNTNPNSPTALNPIFSFNNALVNTTFPAEVLVFESAIVQQIFSPNGTVLAGANFNQNNFPRNAVMWQRYYRDVIRYLVDIINQTKSNPARSNLYNMARIWKAYSYMVLTDTYGDIPYTEAGLGFIGGTTFPKYDTQQSIYTDLIKELSEASAALDAAKAREAGEVMYNGDIPKWKKLGYSLLVRIGMRLSKVNATLAETTVKQAVAGGVFQNNADNSVIKNDATFQNPQGQTLNGTEANNYYLTKNFVDYLKTNNDPRLAAIAARYVGAKSGSEQTAARIDRDPAKQIGMPLGFDNNTIPARATADGLASFYDYSQVDRTRMAKLASPTYFVTHAQTQLLLAEAAQRGWVTTGTAANFYTAGVTAHMQQLADFDAGSTVPAAAITTYLAANPYVASTGLVQINTQYWVASFMNFPETWANFRRSDIPALTPNPYAAKTIQGNFILRLTYPDSENSVNQANLKTAVGTQGADSMDTPVWWDK